MSNHELEQRQYVMNLVNGSTPVLEDYEQEELDNLNLWASDSEGISPLQERARQQLLNKKARNEALIAQYHTEQAETKKQSATPAQLNYIRDLGVNLAGATITKAQASLIIDSVKNGDGVGHLGFTFFGGSN